MTTDKNSFRFKQSSPSDPHLTTVRFDVETRSYCDLKKCGPWVYAKHPSTELLVLKYAVNQNPVQTFIPDMFNGCKVPLLWERLVSSPGVVFEAFNAFFEWSIYNHVLVARFGWPTIKPDRWRCAMATSHYFALPSSLDAVAADALKLDHQKDQDGHRVMMKLSKPRSPSKHNPATYHADPKDFEKLYSYCEKDVETHRAIANRLGSLPEDEQLIWHLDQAINRRGVYCDVPAVVGAIHILKHVTNWYNDEIRELTNGEVQTTGQTAKIQQWLANRGFHYENMQAKTIDDALKNEQLPNRIKRVLTVRKAASKSSVKKYQAMLDRVDTSDGRIRSTLKYHGASTGRWSGSGIQPQNYPRGTFKFYHPKKTPNAPKIDDVVKLMSAHDIEGLRTLGDIPEILSSALRSMLCAPKGKKLVAADYSAIEARVLFWLTGATHGTRIFKTTGLVYEDMAATIYNVPIAEVTEDQRWLGKQAVLGLGYQMGAKKFRDQCAAYGVTISEQLAKRVVDTYRRQYHKVASYWEHINRTAMMAVQTKQPTKCGTVTCYMENDFLRIRLPSGRSISYHKPHFVPSRFNPNELSLAYWGMNSQTHKWQVIHTYGGKLTENIVQAIAGCILRQATINLESNGYPIVLSVHDELVCEVPDNTGYNVENMIGLMCAMKPWADGLPLKAEGWKGMRFKK